MSDLELEQLAGKYKIGNYVDSHGVDRERIIDQLLRKDQANNSRVAIFISIISLFIACFSLWQSFSKDVSLPSTANPIIQNPKIEEPKGIACTLEAKLCPDGSSVGRSGPDCVFSECPSTIKLKDNKDGTQTFTSSVGYNFTFPTKYHPSRNSDWREEQLIDGNCSMNFTMGMGNITSTVVPYKGEPLKDFYLSLRVTQTQGYTVKYEDIAVAGKKGLMVELGPAGDSGSGTTIVVPFNNNYALTLGISYLGKDDPEVRSILKSIKLNELDMSQCGK